MERRKKEKKLNLNPATDPDSNSNSQTEELTETDQTGSEFFYLEARTMTRHIYQADRHNEAYEEAVNKAPEKGLLAALIERTILDLKQPDALTRKQAEKWIFERPTNRVFGVYWCLEWLDMLVALDILRVKCRQLINDKTLQLEDAQKVVKEMLGLEPDPIEARTGHRSPEALFRL